MQNSKYALVGTDLFTHLDKVVRKAKNIDEPFGGCHIVAFGDFYQLLPVCNNSLADDTKHSYGRTLWIDQMWDYFELTTKMRFVSHENCCKDGMCNHISFCYTECGSSRPWQMIDHMGITFGFVWYLWNGLEDLANFVNQSPLQHDES